MSVGVSFAELLDWDEESAAFWKKHFDEHPAQLELPCGIGGAPTVQAFVRHIWAAELRWAQRIANLPVTEPKDFPSGPLDALFALHTEAMEICRGLIADPNCDWNQTLTLNVEWLPPHARTSTHRKLMAHMLFHGHRHWAQLATLLRNAGQAADFRGDMIFSYSLP